MFAQARQCSCLLGFLECGSWFGIQGLLLLAMHIPAKTQSRDPAQTTVKLLIGVSDSRWTGPVDFVRSSDAVEYTTVLLSA